MSDSAPPHHEPDASDADAEPATTRRPSIIPVPAAVPRPSASVPPTSKRKATLPGAASVPPPKPPSVPPPPARAISVPPPKPVGEDAIPGPAPLPRVPTINLEDDVAAAAAAQAAPPPIPSIGTPPPPAPPVVPTLETPPPPRPDTPARAGSDPEGKRRSRRTLKIPDDAVPQVTPAAVAAEIAAPVAAFRAPDAPPRPRSAPPPAPAAPAAAVEAAVAPSTDPMPAAVAPTPILADTDAVAIIRPIAIVDIGPSSPPPPEERPFAAPSAAEPASALAPAHDDDAEEVEPEHEDDGAAEEEVEPERASEPDPEELDVEVEEAVAPKKPPPPPPKRAPDAAPAASAPAASSPAPAATAPAAASPAPAAASGPAPTPTLEAPRKRQKPWWEDLFGDDYIRTFDRLEPKVIRREVDFIEESLGVERGAVVLDLACGAGQHAVELASRGYSVVGYDLSLAMLARAADEAQDRGQKLNFLQGDMREMAFEEMFDGVYCWATSFGYFEDDKNADVLRRMHRALRQGGMLLLDLVNRDYVSPRSPSSVWFEGDGCVAMDEMQVDYFTSRLRVKRMAMFDDGRSRELEYSIRLYALHELGKLLHEAGFKVVEVTGHPAHRGVYFGAESPRIIILAERS